MARAALLIGRAPAVYHVPDAQSEEELIAYQLPRNVCLVIDDDERREEM